MSYFPHDSEKPPLTREVFFISVHSRGYKIKMRIATITGFKF